MLTLKSPSHNNTTASLVSDGYTGGTLNETYIYTHQTSKSIYLTIILRFTMSRCAF